MAERIVLLGFLVTSEIGEATSHRSGSSRQRFEHLDMLRGLAALLVLIGHVRGFVFLDYPQLTGSKLLVAPLYIIGGLGHQAVMLFFALSGFLVGGRALREIRSGDWNLPDYTVHRFARLWTALIPALLATALLDWVGRDLLHLAGYNGEYSAMLSSGPQPDGPATDTLAAFAGNIAFLQGIAVPIFGTNGPLWSLANEFWYYFLVPFAWMALAGQRYALWARLFAGVTAAFILLWLPGLVIVLGSIWIAGAGAWALSAHIMQLPGRRFGWLVAAVSIAIVAAGIGSMALPGTASDLALGMACAAALPCLARLANPGGLYGRIAFWISEISFTLYVVHFPLIALVWFALVAPHQFPPVIAGFATAAGLIVIAIAFALALWWLFERNTPRVRRGLLRALGIKKS